MPDKPPDKAVVDELASWRPAGGVLSVYLETDPAARRQPWRSTLKDRLRKLVEAHDGAARKAMGAAAERMLARLPAEPEGRCLVGFVEVAERPQREFWRYLQTSPRGTWIVHGKRPYLLPLLQLLDDGAPVGVLIASAERVRLLEWGLGRLAEIDAWEPEITPTAVDVSQQERVESHRERFLQDAGRKARVFLDDRGWRALLAFGDKPLIREIRDGLGERPELRLAGEQDLINAQRADLLEKIEGSVAEFNRERELALVQHARDAALAANGRGALGLTDTQAALEQARVEHLLLAMERPSDVRGPDDPNEAGNGSIDPIPDPAVREQLIERAILTSAAVTPVEGEAAATLHEHGGVGAILRY